MNSNMPTITRKRILVKFIILTLLLFNFGVKSIEIEDKVSAQEYAVGDPLTIDNFSNGATVRYDLPLLIGTASNSSHVTVENGDSIVQWSVNNGNWRAFVPLTEGDNDIHIQTDSGRVYEFQMTYVPQDNGKYVRLVYPMGSDSSGTFDAPIDQPNSSDNAVARIALSGRILQSLTAELLVDAGGGRQTFRLLRDAEGNVIVDTPRSYLTVNELWEMEGVDLWYHYYELFSSYPNRTNIKDIAIMADTHYDESSGELYSHTALGGGRLALFGGSTLYSYPESVQEIESHFTDSTPVESYLFPEYGRRQEYWATLTTSVGAILHEAGHSFGLSHPETPLPGDIMYRGFDYLNRAITTYEPYLGSIDPNDIMPRWTPEDVSILTTEDWLQSGVSGGGNGGPELIPAEVDVTPSVVTLMESVHQTTQIDIPVNVQIDWSDLTWTAHYDTDVFPDLAVTPSNGNTNTNAIVSIDLTSYPVGTYSDSITFTVVSDEMADKSVTLTLTVVIAEEVYSTYLPLMHR